ncbi:MAG: aromatic ring-hydroxylating dioxygenase subunit alpha [Rhodospirillaceae bacterium]|nr:aromatic ring-hydroxylating dioxygenase subunit alpha [Rhodospirillaceae bacterium]MYF86728.1 aromatic ring-hydroxylating dioxygenase subunit alpha [Rhodospirillaceae bacterium]MYH36832.1 aromatic ring-hydroxylating dioxygenase subunit alpha [Rhodospirillaceae bacterium]MYK15858.1 aromatic ring-hydroxylating dioxygenase subunit alpha [Rhodospirillaceae bacterium]
MTTGAEIDALLETGLPEQWYALLPANWVRDEPVGITRLGRRLVLWRDGDGAVRVHTDRCPHRGARFSQGHVIDGLLTCTYHGMQFDGDGTVVRVPAYPGCQLEGMQGVQTWPAVEKADCIFAWMGEGEPAPLSFPPEFDDPAWSHFLCTGTWQGSYLYALENVVDPMHGTYLHAKSYTLAYGSGADEMEIERTGDGFTVRRTQQVGRNFDWTEFHSTGADWVRLDLPYPPGAGPGGMFRILGYITPVDAGACQVFFWRFRKVEGWQRDLWRFMYKSRLEERHWHVLEQDRVVIEQMEPPEAELLYQHDIGVTHLRRLLQRQARDHLKSRAAPPLAAE